MRTILRQGDVLLVKIREKNLDDAARVARQAGRLVLADGEATGHAHAIDEALAELFEDRRGVLYLRVQAGRPAQLVHEEHAALDLAPGLYRIVHQREYAPDAIRRVAD